MEEQKKKVDESYKEKVEKDKEKAEGTPSQPQDARQKEEFIAPEASFSFFVTSLAMQASIALGDAPEPQANKSQANLPQAKFLIDIIGVVQEKTKGNLTQEEDSLLEGILYELRMRYVEKSGGTK